MTYRRRGRGRVRYVRAGGRKLLWVRNIAVTVNQLSTATIWAVDLLAPLHFSENVEMKIGTTSGVVVVPTTGATVVRTHLSVTTLWQNDTGPVAWDDKLYHGVLNTNMAAAAAATVERAVPAGELTEYDPYVGANLGDWAFWDCTTPYQPSAVSQSETIIHAIANTSSFDIKSKRKLAEPGDSWVYCSRYSGGGAGPDKQQVISSTLLALP